MTVSLKMVPSLQMRNTGRMMRMMLLVRTVGGLARLVRVWTPVSRPRGANLVVPGCLADLVAQSSIVRLVGLICMGLMDVTSAVNYLG